MVEEDLSWIELIKVGTVIDKAITKRICIRPICFEKWTNNGRMEKIYGHYGWLNFVDSTKKQSEKGFVH
jgi:hypothetical protein